MKKFDGTYKGKCKHKRWFGSRGKHDATTKIVCLDCGSSSFVSEPLLLSNSRFDSFAKVWSNPNFKAHVGQVWYVKDYDKKQNAWLKEMKGRKVK